LCGDAREILVLKVSVIAIPLQNIEAHVLSKTEALNRGPKSEPPNALYETFHPIIKFIHCPK